MQGTDQDWSLVWEMRWGWWGDSHKRQSRGCPSRPDGKGLHGVGSVVMAVHTREESGKAFWSWNRQDMGNQWPMRHGDGQSNMILRLPDGWWLDVPTFWARELSKWHWYVARRGVQFWTCGVWGARHQLKTSGRHESKTQERSEAKSWEGIKSENWSESKNEL